ncbi:MAG: hypothetical protein KDB07_13595 [Planctomycetes bacterium]|nr:hypothetical protein [Planctomycetota bacterium]
MSRKWSKITGLGVGVALLFLSFACTPKKPSPAPPDPRPALTPLEALSSREVAMRKAADYLWSKQAEEGSWPSEVYGIMKAGHATTPFVLYALLQVPENIARRPIGGVERALTFMRDALNDDGWLGHPKGGVREYPTYATAFALRCFVKAGSNKNQATITKMRMALEKAQLTTSRTIRDDYGREIEFPLAPYGAWSNGMSEVRGEQVGHVDLSHTRFVLQALREAKSPQREVFGRAIFFLELCQKESAQSERQPPIPFDEVAPIRPEDNPPLDGATLLPDGGFYFSPIVLGANKWQHHSDSKGRPTLFRSYPTATCDGVLALLAYGATPENSAVMAAEQWLRRHPKLELPEGMPESQPTPWDRAMRYYHWMVRAEAYAALAMEGDWRDQLAALVTKEQREEGSFVNAEGLMKENDPLLATSMALIALGRCGQVIQ